MPLEFYEDPAKRVARLKRDGKFCNAGTEERPCVQTAVHKVTRVTVATDTEPEGPPVITQVCSKHRKFHINDPRFRVLGMEDLPWRGRKEVRLTYAERVAKEQAYIAAGRETVPGQVKGLPTPDMPTARPGQKPRPARATRPAGPPSGTDSGPGSSTVSTPPRPATNPFSG